MGVKGFKHSKETRKKMSLAREGIIFTEEHKRNISRGHKGKKLSDAHKKKLSDVMKKRFFSKEHRRRISESLKGHAVSDKVRKNMVKLGKSGKGKVRSEDHCRKLSESVSRAYVEGRLSNNVRRVFEYRGLKFRSSWELKVAKWLDENNIGWEYELFKFKLSNGRHYIPDFRLSDDEFIEVKGYLQESDVIKMNEFVEAGNKLYMVDKSNIDCIGLNKLWNRKCHAKKSRKHDLLAWKKLGRKEVSVGGKQLFTVLRRDSGGAKSVRSKVGKNKNVTETASIRSEVNVDS